MLVGIERSPTSVGVRRPTADDLRPVVITVVLRHPTREVPVDGPVSVVKLLRQLDLQREGVLVIADGTLVPGDSIIDDGTTVEIRPVISGGAGVPEVGRGIERP